MRVRRKVFVSHSHLHQRETDAFIARWVTQEGLFIPKVLGVAQNDHFVDSRDPEYVMRRIREKYLEDSTVTIVLIGSCTHSRRYIDWELKASLRQGESEPNGLVGILLPSAGGSAHLPQRFAVNWSQDGASYASFISMPESCAALEAAIESAHQRRTTHARFVRNGDEMMSRNSVCKVHGVTH